MVLAGLDPAGYRLDRLVPSLSFTRHQHLPSQAVDGEKFVQHRTPSLVIRRIHQRQKVTYNARLANYPVGLCKLDRSQSLVAPRHGHTDLHEWPVRGAPNSKN